MNETKTAVSISEMARMVGLSRARFYQLIGKTFPWPLYSVATGRPFYDEELQQVCLEVRRRNCGIDGRPVMFYSVKKRKPLRISKTDNYNPLLEGLKSLGLVVGPDQVEAAIRELFPERVDGLPQGEVLRTVFLHLQRQDRSDNVGR